MKGIRLPNFKTVRLIGFQECDEEDVETCITCDAEECGFRMLNDEEIVISVQKESDPIDDDNNNESSKGLSNADAFSALETAMEWYEQQSECCPTQLLLLKRIRDLAAKKWCSMVQRTLNEYFFHNKESDEDIRLSESESKESADEIDNISVNTDIYVTRNGTEWIPHNSNVPGRFATPNVLQ
ncbi:uncharacterized protein TNCV_1845291 [Trichonephila clavipes]|nr:uncharacterized protein TNCV_1845291 [Trichonephila clavipes]